MCVCVCVCVCVHVCVHVCEWVRVEGKYGINQLEVDRSLSGQYHWHLLKQIDNIELVKSYMVSNINQ